MNDASLERPLASYAKQSQDKSLYDYAQRIAIRATKRCGELLAQIRPAKTGPKQLGADGGTQLNGRIAAGKTAGLSRRQTNTALRVANVPESIFEELTEGEHPPTVTEMAKLGTKSQLPKRAPEEAEQFYAATHTGSPPAVRQGAVVNAPKRH